MAKVELSLLVKALVEGRYGSDGKEVDHEDDAVCWSEKEVSIWLGWSVTHVYQLLVLANAPEDIKEWASSGEISPTAAIWAHTRYSEGAWALVRAARQRQSDLVANPRSKTKTIHVTPRHINAVVDPRANSRTVNWKSVAHMGLAVLGKATEDPNFVHLAQETQEAIRRAISSASLAKPALGESPVYNNHQGGGANA